MGTNRRRRRRRGGARGQQAPQQAAPAPATGLRATIDSFGGFLTIGVAAATIAVVAALIWFNRPDGGGAVAGGPYELRERAAPAAGRLLGDPDAPVRIVAFEDFDCSHCGTFNRETEPLLEEEYVNAGVASIEFRHLAILGPDSERAAAAAECAADQNLFWPYHDILFLRQGSDGWASNGNLRGFAREVAAALPDGAFDLGAFDDCVGSGVKELVVRSLSGESEEIVSGIRGSASTPAFLVNGQPLFGAQPIEAFRDVIDRLAPDG